MVSFIYCDDISSFLIHIIQKVNQEINQTTKIPPYVLFQKEKEYLNLLPNKILLDSYIDEVITRILFLSA